MRLRIHMGIDFAESFDFRRPDLKFWIPNRQNFCGTRRIIWPSILETWEVVDANVERQHVAHAAVALMSPSPDQDGGHEAPPEVRAAVQKARCEMARSE